MASVVGMASRNERGAATAEKGEQNQNAEQAANHNCVAHIFTTAVFTNCA